jgi:hypothetical protein
LITTQIDKFRNGPEEGKTKNPAAARFYDLVDGQPDELTPEQNRQGKNADP